MRDIIKILFLSFLAAVMIDCGNKDKSLQEGHQVNKQKSDEEQLNITILLDLSDRINPAKYPSKPEHFERDIEIVKYFTELFKRDMNSKGAFMANGKIKVIFSPRPNDDDINNIASNLSVDLSTSKNTKEKKEIFDNLSADFSSNLERIYSIAIKEKTYPGSDIWRFFKNDVVDYCIDNDTSYRNILVLITDGYIFHEDSQNRQRNRSASLLPRDIELNGFRNGNWKEKFESKDYGYITTREDLDNLDVLVLEISPSTQHLDDEDVLKAYLNKWFAEMNVNAFQLYTTDLPEYTKSRIDNFIPNE